MSAASASASGPMLMLLRIIPVLASTACAMYTVAEEIYLRPFYYTIKSYKHKNRKPSPLGIMNSNISTIIYRVIIPEYEDGWLFTSLAVTFILYPLAIATAVANILSLNNIIDHNTTTSTSTSTSSNPNLNPNLNPNPNPQAVLQYPTLNLDFVQHQQQQYLILARGFYIAGAFFHALRLGFGRRDMPIVRKISINKELNEQENAEVVKDWDGKNRFLGCVAEIPSWLCFLSAFIYATATATA